MTDIRDLDPRFVQLTVVVLGLVVALVLFRGQTVASAIVFTYALAAATGWAVTYVPQVMALAELDVAEVLGGESE